MDSPSAMNFLNIDYTYQKGIEFRSLFDSIFVLCALCFVL
jgi:hypothetical protein